MSRWPEIRSRILERDGAVCGLCGITGADTVDHITPQIFGGQHDDQNLRAAHRDCNVREFWRVQRYRRPGWSPKRRVVKPWEYPSHFTDEQFAIIRNVQRKGKP